MDCGDCKFFRQHYVISSRRYMALEYGHCVARCRKKMYAADTTACERYEQSTGETLPPESEFIYNRAGLPKSDGIKRLRNPAAGAAKRCAPP